MTRSASRRAVAALAMLAAVGLFLQAGSVPHLHDGDEAGFYNQEHDLTLLAGLASYGLPIESTPAVTLEAVAAALPPSLPERPPIRPAYAADSRAPPAA